MRKGLSIFGYNKKAPISRGFSISERTLVVKKGLRLRLGFVAEKAAARQREDRLI